MSAEIIHGDCLEVMRGMADSSVDSIVTDPPYGISFMSKKWDHDVPSEAIWREALRVLKPGGHLLAFFGSRTYHRGVVRIEDAGFEIRDQIMWVYGSGFPKSLAVSKALDKAAGVRGHDSTGFNSVGQPGARSNGGDKLRSDHPDYVKPSGVTDAAKQWDGWGTALKPAHEPLVLARKPPIGTVAQNVQAHGTGALNIDGCRIGNSTRTNASRPAAERNGFIDGFVGGTVSKTHDHGRWPANFIHDGSDEVLALFPETRASTGGSGPASKQWKGDGRTVGANLSGATGGFGDSGSAARFFYTAKASKKDRGEGNTHATVKPTDLMRYLVRLITPPGGTVLDPFCGSGSTLKAAVLEGFNSIGIELDAEYVQIARDRIANTQPALLETA